MVTTKIRATSPVFQPLSLAELAALPIPPLEWVVDGLAPRGSLGLFSAREKAGKSLLATDLAACVATGEPFLGRVVTQGPAMLVPAEEHLREVRDRLLQRLDGDTTPPVHVVPVNRTADERLDLADPAAIPALHALIEQIRPAVLILDPFRELHDRSENDSDAMSPLLRPLRNLAHETDVAVVLLHHMGRSGSFRGSTAIRASCDLEWAFRRPEETGTELHGTLTVEGRYGPRQELAIRLGAGLRWEATGAAPPRALSTQTRIIELLTATDVDDAMTAPAIAGAIGAEVKTVQNVLAEASAKGVIPLRVVGSGRKNDPKRYALRLAS